MSSLPHLEARQEMETVDLHHLMTVLWRGRKTIVLCAIVVTALALVFAVTQAPQYRSGATVLIDPDNERVLDFQAALQNRPMNEGVIESEIGVLTSNTVLRQVIEDLGLDEDPDFVPSLVPFSERSLMSKARSVVRSGIGGVRWAFGLFSSPASDDPQSRITDADGEVPNWRVALLNLAGSVSARQIETSYVIALSVQTESAVKSAEIANAIVERYIALARNNKREDASNAIRWLTAEIVKLEADVKRSSDAVDAFRVERSLTNRDQIEAASLQFDRLRQSVREATQAHDAVQTQLAELSDGTTATDAAPNNNGRVLQERERGLKLRLDTLQASLETSQTRLVELTGAWARLDQLERQALADQRLYERFLEQMKTVNALENFQQVDARLVSPALPPLGPSNPSTTLLVLMAGILGVGIGVAVVGGSELLRRSFHSREELEKFTGLPVATAMPLVPNTADHRSIVEMVQQHPNSELAESLRRLRSHILRGRSLRGERIIMVTSSMPDEGKSLTAFMLAWVLVKANYKAVVLDLDLHRSPFTKSAKLRDPSNLEGLINGKLDPRAAVVQDEMFNVPVLSLGAGKGQPSDFLASINLSAIVSRLGSLYDFVIVDTPPLGPIADVSSFSTLVDAAIFVIDWQRTSRPIITEGLKQLERLDVKVVGTVLTKVDTKVEAHYRSLPYTQYSAYSRPT